MLRTLAAAIASVIVLVLLASSAGAEDGSIRLGIEAVDSEYPYFNVSLSPGEAAELTVRFANHGEVPTGVTVFPADVYTIIGGGMGTGELDDPPTGATTWLSFESATMDLDAGEVVEQTFDVSIPEDASPGDYITSIVIQNTEPREIETGDAPFSQTVRQGVAVAIDVPGDREPAMDFDGMRHSVTGGSSVIEVDLENTGNAHLRPSGTFALQDTEGGELASSSIGLDTVYAGTSTIIEVMFTSELPADDYLISVFVEDEETGATASADGLELSIAAPEPTPEPDDGLAGAVESAEDALADDPVLTALIAGTIAVIGVLVVLAAVMLGRARPDMLPVQPPVPAGQMPSPVPPRAPSEKRREARPPIRQLKPRK